MKSSELKLGHAYKLAGKEGPAFYINCHPHDGATQIMAWWNLEEDEEEYLAVDSCEIEHEIFANVDMLVFTEQYEAFMLASRVLQNLPTTIAHIKAIEEIAARVQKTATSQGDSLWHALETIDDRCHDLLTLLEEGDFNALTGADKREEQMVRLRRDSYRYAKARSMLRVSAQTPEQFDALVDAVEGAAPQQHAQAALSDEQIKAIFMKNGFTIKEGQSDLKPYVYAAAHAILAASHQPAAAPAQPVADLIVHMNSVEAKIRPEYSTFDALKVGTYPVYLAAQPEVKP